MTSGYTIEALGEDALLLRLGDRIDDAVNERVHALAAGIDRQRPAWLLDIVPAFATLALCVDVDAFPATAQPLAELESWLGTLDAATPTAGQPTRARCHEIPVHYGGGDGPDLQAVAAHAGIEPAELIRRHSAATYRVGMLGFAAGFPYLMGMDARLAMARHATPRTRVAAGSVGIGGAQTGIYPQEGPGGWQIIGRTGVRLFDASKDPPALLHPGDSLRFFAVDAHGAPLS